MVHGPAGIELPAGFFAKGSPLSGKSPDDLPRKVIELKEKVTSRRDYLLAVSEEAVDILASLLSLVIVARAHGLEGLGVYSFLLSLFVIGSYLFEFGTARYVEREIALGRGRSGVDDLFLMDVQKAALLSALAGFGGVLLLGGIHAGAVSVSGVMGFGYLVVAAAVGLNILNSVNVAILHGLGRHAEASRASMKKRALFVGLVFLFSTLRFNAVFVLPALVFAEAAAMSWTRGKQGLPSLARSFRELHRASPVFKEGFQYYFTDEAFRVVIFLDLFILGFFVSPLAEGAYSEASVLARLFLIIPFSAAPIFRTRYYRISTEGGMDAVRSESRREAARLFTIHSLLGLTILLYFPHILRLVFKVQGDVPMPFRIFSILLPGLLYLGSAIVVEPLYTVSGQRQRLGRAALRVFLLNAFLNFYLIPYAGVLGAATATSVSLLVYFMLFARSLDGRLPFSRTTYLAAGLAVYVAYELFSSVRWPGIFVLPVMAVFIVALFWLIGMYGGDEEAEFSIQKTAG
jgi:O-antigen/teichoic acid export membrane protein